MNIWNRINQKIKFSICKIEGHKWFISLYTDYKIKHCARCCYCEEIK